MKKLILAFALPLLIAACSTEIRTTTEGNTAPVPPNLEFISSSNAVNDPGLFSMNLNGYFVTDPNSFVGTWESNRIELNDGFGSYLQVRLAIQQTRVQQTSMCYMKGTTLYAHATASSFLYSNGDLDVYTSDSAKTSKFGYDCEATIDAKVMRASEIFNGTMGNSQLTFTKKTD